MDHITVAELLHTIQQATNVCTTVGTVLYGLQANRNETDSSLGSLGAEVNDLRNIMLKLSGCLGSQISNPECYTDTLQVIAAGVEDCTKYMKALHNLLDMVRDDFNHTVLDGSHTITTRFPTHKIDLIELGSWVRKYKHEMRLSFSTLVVCICSELARRDKITDHRLLAVSDLLEKVMAKKESLDTHCSLDKGHDEHLEETAGQVLYNARSALSSTISSSPMSIYDIASLSLRDMDIGTDNQRLGIEEWIKELRTVEEEDEEEFSPASKLQRCSIPLPEVMFGRNVVGVSKLHSTVGRAADATASIPTSEQIHEEATSDDFDKLMIHRLIEQGKKHFMSDNRVQAAEFLTRALYRAGQLGAISYQEVDLTEPRSILATLALQDRDLDSAEHYLLALRRETQMSEQSYPLICKAYHQLAEVYLLRCNYAEAESYCKKAIDVRLRDDGPESQTYYEAIQLLTLIYHRWGSNIEADVAMTMLPPSWQDETRQTMLDMTRATIVEFKPLSGSLHQLPKFGSSSFAQHCQSMSLSSSVYSCRNSSVPATTAETRQSGSYRQSSVAHVRAASDLAHQDVCLAQLAEAGFSGDFDASRALSWAIQAGQLRIVHLLLEGYPVVKAKRRFSRKYQGDLLRKQVSPNGSAKDKTRPLMQAITHSQVLIVKLLLDRGARHNIEDSKGRTPLLKAAEVGNVEVIKLLLCRQLAIQAHNVWSPWHEAAQHGHAAVLKVFLDHGASIDAQDRAGATALKVAAARGHRAACELLLQHHADVDLTSRDGGTPLISAVRNGHTTICALLLQHNATVDLANAKQQTPLGVAAHEGREQEVRLLLNTSGAKTGLEKADDRGFTPLMTAARAGCVEIVQLLLQAGANVHAHCNRKSTALDQALAARQRHIEKFLRDAGARKGSELTEPHMLVHDAFKGYAM